MNRGGPSSCRPRGSASMLEADSGDPAASVPAVWVGRVKAGRVLCGYAGIVAKVREIFVCRSCGGVQSRWLGKCPDCGGWDTLEPERVEKGAKSDPQKGLVEAWASLADGGGAVGGAVAGPITEVGADEAVERIATGIGELDRVLGYGAERENGEAGAPGSGGAERGRAGIV